MSNRYPRVVLLCLGLVTSISTTRAKSCGFVTPHVTSSRSNQHSTLRTALSNEPEASYSDLPSDWRAPLNDVNPARRSEPTKDTANGTEGKSSDIRGSPRVAQETTSETESAVRRRSVRKPDPPPEIASLQTQSQRRRNLPLSQLKRVKPKKKSLIDDEEGEFRPLLPKTDRESVLRGEDYWIDYREVDAAAKVAAKREARAKAPAPDQFAESKMRAEIVNPYKQNWILAISIAIVAVAEFIKLNPGILDESVITFPKEL